MTIAQLAETINAGDVAGVRAILDARPELVDMEMAYADEHRPIHFAVLARTPEIVRLLMQRGADARKGIHPHRDATAALTLATERGYDDIVAIIKDEETRRPPKTAKADRFAPRDDAARAAVARGDADWLRARHAEGALTNPIEWSRGGLLTAAVEHDRPESLTLLLDFGFDPDERVRSTEVDEDHYSQGFPLWHCAAHGKPQLAEILLQRGANPNVHVDSSGSPVYSALSHRQGAMVDLLRRYGGVIGADTAAIYRQTDLAREMLSTDATHAEELLTFAASGGDPEIVRMSLEHIDWRRDDRRWFRVLAQPLDFWNHTPWLSAAHHELDRATYLACFRLILERCDANLRGSFGRTVLHEVAATGTHVTDEESAAFATLLLDAGARTNVRDDLLQSTPLGWACRWGREGVVKALLAGGADRIEADAPAWATPVAWATKTGHERIAASLRTEQPR